MAVTVELRLSLDSRGLARVSEHTETLTAHMSGCSASRVAGNCWAVNVLTFSTRRVEYRPIVRAGTLVHVGNGSGGNITIHQSFEARSI